MIEKSCPQCGERFVTKRKDKRYCKTLCSQRAWAARHPDRVIANTKRQNANAPKRIYTRMKSRAKRAGIPFDLDVSDIVIPSHCPVLGTALEDSNGRGQGGLPNVPSVDRIHPDKGYVKGNVRVISMRANRIKSNLTVNEVRSLLNYMENNQ